MHYIRRGVEESRTHIRRGITEFKKGNFSNALSSFEDALKANPDAVVALQYRGICKCLLAVNTDMKSVKIHNDINEAILDFKQIAELFTKISANPLFKNRYF